MPRGVSPRRRVRTVRHFAISDKLKPADRLAVDAMLREPDVSQRNVHLWLAARGCDVSLPAICRYRQRLLADDREREAAAEKAAADGRRRVLYVRLARDGEVVDTDVAGALVMHLEALVFRSLLLLRPPRDAGGRYFLRYARMIRAVLDVRRGFHAPRQDGAAPAGPPPLDGLNTAGDLAAFLAAEEPAVAAPRRRRRFRTPWKMEQLPPDVLRRYEAEVIDDPKSTAASGRKWLAAAGYDASLATVMRHRVRVLQRRGKESAAAAFLDTARAAAEAYRLTPADFAAADPLRTRVALLMSLSDALAEVKKTRRPMPPEQLTAIAAAVRAHLR